MARAGGATAGEKGLLPIRRPPFLHIHEREPGGKRETPEAGPHLTPGPQPVLLLSLRLSRCHPQTSGVVLPELSHVPLLLSSNTIETSTGSDGPGPRLSRPELREQALGGRRENGTQAGNRQRHREREEERGPAPRPLAINENLQGLRSPGHTDPATTPVRGRIRGEDAQKRRREETGTADLTLSVL